MYRAEDLVRQRPVALKLLPQSSLPGDELRLRFLTEARMAAALNHPNICAIYEVGEVEPGKELSLDETSVPTGAPFIAMELVEGETLHALLSKSRALPIGQILDIAVQVAEGLAEAHRRRIVHRDLKPHNTIVDPLGRVKILDFGLARPCLWPTIGSTAPAGRLASGTPSIDPC